MLKALTKMRWSEDVGVDCEKERNEGNGATAAVMVAACFEACEQGKRREERVRLLRWLDSMEMGGCLVERRGE